MLRAPTLPRDSGNRNRWQVSASVCKLQYRQAVWSSYTQIHIHCGDALLTSHHTPHSKPRRLQQTSTLSRREFVQGLAAASLLLSTGARQADAAPTSVPAPAVLRGTEFDLVVEEQAINLTGATRMATTINGTFPAPTLVWREGDTVTIRVTNRLREDTSIH